MDKNSEKMNINVNDILKALDNTDVSIFLYYPQEKKVVIPAERNRQNPNDVVYTNMPYSFAESHIIPKDRDRFIEMYERIYNGEKMSSARFHFINSNIYLKDTLTTIAWDEDGKPLTALGVNCEIKNNYRNEQIAEQMPKIFETENLSGKTAEVTKTIASAISGQYYAIYHIWVESRTYVCFHENRECVLATIGEKSDYDTALDFYIKNFVVAEDQAAMQEFTDLSTVKERLRDHHTISRAYRQNDIGWTRGTFIVGKRDKTGNVITVIYSVSDINAEIKLEEKRKQAIFESEHDPLTGVYNRKGLEKIVSSKNLNNISIGFAIIDIDNFKSLNDNFGHAVGDQILVAVAEQLSAVFHHDDVVARIGGDEFAILFRNCNASSWNKICLKLHTIHATLANCFPKSIESNITLSVGLAFSNTGYSQQLYQLADEGLYETKRLGRAGCTLMEQEHKILKRWQDESISVFAKNVLEYNSTGVCQIEIPNNPKKQRRLLCGNAEKTIMAIPTTATPEESYVIWRERIEPSYRETLLRVKQSMIEYGQTECTFLWNHPKHGAIFMRCGGFGEKKEDKIVLSGYCHVLMDTQIIEHQDDQSLVLHALNETFVSSYYLDLEKNTAVVFKLGPGRDDSSDRSSTVEELIQDFIANIVDSRDQELMQDFLNIDTLQKRFGNDPFLDADYRRVGSLCWFRLRLLPVRYDNNGKLSHVLLTTTAMTSDMLKGSYTLDNDRRSLAALFDHLPCGIVMYEWSGSDKSLKAVHISKYYKEHSGHTFMRIDENNQLHLNFNCIHPDDANACHEAIIQAFKNTHQLHHEYRVWNENVHGYIWERVDAIVSDAQNNTQLIYAVYTDVTKQKEQELSLKKSKASLLASLEATNQLCYEYDPIQRTAECLTDNNFFGLPKRIENFPDCFKGISLLHPEDENTFIKTAHETDNGKEQAHCDVRIKKNGDYCWYSCTFNNYYDAQKGQHVVIMNIVDISLRMATLKMYEDRLHSLVSITENTVCMTMLNLTKNTYEILECKDRVKPLLDDTLPLEEFMSKAADGIVGEESRKRYFQWFNPKYLLQQAEKGNMHVETEYILNFGPKQYEWVLSAVDLVRNPLTGEVSGTAYNISIQTAKMNKFLLERTLQQDYMFVAVIFVDTDEFYLFNPSKGKYSKRMQDYWEIALSGSKGHCSEKTYRELLKNITKKNILDYLEKNSEYRYAYDGIVNDQLHRLEISFSYADADHTMLIASMRNITDSELLKRYRHDSEHDFLTDLYNRKTMMRKCRELLKDYPNDQFVMLHVDIKHFRLYNTFFGDAAGDKLLCDMADIFREINNDYEHWAYGRMESDVFAAFFPYNKEMYQRHAMAAIEKLKNYRSDFLIELTFGLYFVTDREMSIEAMFTRATLAAKMVQPDTPYATVVFNDVMEKTLKDNQKILSEMQIAIEQEQFKVYLQPKYSLRTQQPVGAEALVRWVHPIKGIISPGRFIPVFERNGFIAELDRYMWEHTCRLLSQWKKEGRKLLPISVNISRISAYSQDTVAYLKNLVQKYDIEPQYLELELTESAYVEDQELIRSRLTDLQKFGFKILMDDFGSGYSSLNTLKDLPIDVLKLDMHFLSSSDTGRGRKILSSIIRMSKYLNLPVIAEGVETEEQANYLRSIGCEYVQGFLYARPMPVFDYENTVLNSLQDTIDLVSNSSQYSTLIDNVLHDSGQTQFIDDTLPIPIILVEYNTDKFCCLHANKAFIYDFGLKKDLRPASMLIKEHLSEQDYNRMLRAFQKSSETKQNVIIKIDWLEDGGTCHKYRVNIVCEGAIGAEQILMVTFIDEEPQNYFE